MKSKFHVLVHHESDCVFIDFSEDIIIKPFYLMGELETLFSDLEYKEANRLAKQEAKKFKYEYKEESELRLNIRRESEKIKEEFKNKK